MLCNYFLIISLASLLYFNWLPNEMHIGDIFWFGACVQVVIVVVRPRVQDVLMKMFYPREITKWAVGRQRGQVKRPKSGGGTKLKKRKYSEDDSE